MQPAFRKASLFKYLILGLVIVGAYRWLASVSNRQDEPAELAAVRFTPARFDPAGFAPLHLVGAWKVAVADPRFGGISALAVDAGKLVALSDSGTVIHLPMPGASGRAMVHDLPAGPGSAAFKKNRDSEALTRDPLGRGWWVAFENWDQLWLYDPQFRNALGRIDLGRRGWKPNKGVEGLAANGATLVAFAETGQEWLQIRDAAIRSHRVANRFGYISDAVRVPDGRLLVVTREVSLTGLAKRLAVAEEGKSEVLTLRLLAPLSLGATDNVEAIAAEPRPGGTRLWLMTDNDFRSRAPTYLVALDLP